MGDTALCRGEAAEVKGNAEVEKIEGTKIGCIGGDGSRRNYVNQIKPISETTTQKYHLLHSLTRRAATLC